MKTYPKKRIDIMVEEPLMPRLIALLDQLGVSGYTVLPALAGRGRDGTWHRDGVVGRAGMVVQISCILDASRVDAVIEPLFKMVSRQIGIVTLSDVEVLRADHF